MNATRRRTAAFAAVGLTLAEAVLIARRRGTLLAADTVVRCRQGHLFTTLWIPGASLKAIRLGLWRLQRCPVGGHWTLVTPVRTSELTAEQRELASREHDLRIF
jgi:hypothetical protein